MNSVTTRGRTLADNAAWTDRVRVKSKRSGKWYTIARRKSDDVWGCSCPGWVFNGTCRHLKAFHKC